MQLLTLLTNLNRGAPAGTLVANSIRYGSLKKDGSHDHRTNRGQDRTVAQKRGDRTRSKPRA